MIDLDRRIEIGIIAQRQRRRFNQVRSLRIPIPDNYKRVYSVLNFPKAIQEALVTYPKLVEDDSDYEDDDQVVKKYGDDPLKYVESQDARKREAIQ